MIESLQSALRPVPAGPLTPLGSDVTVFPSSAGEASGTAARPADTATFSAEAIALLLAEQCAGGT